MAAGIFRVLLLLIAAVAVKQLLLSSGEKAIVGEKERTGEILQRLKEQEANIQLLHLHLKKVIADVEAKQKALTKIALALQRKGKVLQCIRKVLCLVAVTLFRLWE